MKTEKQALESEAAFDKILGAATRSKNPDARKVVLLLRYSGMHICVLRDSKYNLREKEDKGDTFIVWDRPKKVGKEAYTSILKSRHIDYNVGEFAKDVQGRKAKRSPVYWWMLIKKIGEEAGVSGLSQMTFRHTLGVDMAERGVPRDIIRDTLNCSEKVLSTYMKFGKERKRRILKGIDW